MHSFQSRFQKHGDWDWKSKNGTTNNNVTGIAKLRLLRATRLALILGYFHKLIKINWN